jgi:hypothetical protein
MTLGFRLLIDFKPSTGLAKIIIYQCIGALGSGLLIQPPLVAIQANVVQEHTATATSKLTFVRGLAQAISVVIGGVVFQSSMNLRRPVLANAGISDQLLNTFSGEDAQVRVVSITLLRGIAYSMMSVQDNDGLYSNLEPGKWWQNTDDTQCGTTTPCSKSLFL